MKRFLFAFCILLLTVTALWAAEMMSVQIEVAQLRGRPSNLGPIVGELAYADRIEVLNQQGAWYQVKTSDGKVGWLPGQVLSPKEIRLSSSGNVSSGASSEEVALAGKGFNAQVEQEYKSQHQLDYSKVDEMELWGVESEVLVSFLEEGNLGEAIQ